MDNWKEVKKAWDAIYQEHWDNCQEPICATCCRVSYEEWEEELKRREERGHKNTD